MPKNKCVRVGYGTVSQIHETKMLECNVETVAIVEVDEQKRFQAQQEGFTVFSSCQEAAKLNPTFWDICVSTNQHLSVIQSILDSAPQANIFIEKPICLFSEIPALRRTLLNFEGKITVNENYASSTIKNMVQTIAFNELQIHPEKIVVEFTKNRELDFARGRFIDRELGSLGYEGSHMVTLVSEMLEDYVPYRILENKFSDLIFKGSDQLLENQGSAYVRYKSLSQVEIELYTSLAGTIKYKHPLFCIEDIPHDDLNSKYRFIAVYGTNYHNDKYCVVGFFEPINSFKRCQGAVYVTLNNKVERIVAPLRDDTMLLHFQQTLKYFQGVAENPYSVEKSIKIVEILNSFTDEMRFSKSLHSLV
ncbi:MAG: Gfo/Idh/MocA family oxidoreductase [Rhizonema sp. NSF051]|nr:Gfo/Idh/MocA family oxidoreductase [Rhizonema sp. NSF051]